MKELEWNTIGFLNRYLRLQFEFDQASTHLNISHLNWDSSHFNAGMHKLNYVPENCTPEEIKSILPKKTSQGKRLHCYAEVPSEANGAIQVLSKIGFTLVESRITYFHLLEDLNSPINLTRAAVEADIPWLRKTASGAVRDINSSVIANGDKSLIFFSLITSESPIDIHTSVYKTDAPVAPTFAS